jgi:radical SAM protein with 4Fe4S-binding SPASM domain
MKRFAEEDLGLDFSFDAMINQRIDCSPRLLNVRLTPDEVVALYLQESKRMAEWNQFADQFIRSTPPERQDAIYRCGGGMNAFAIDPHGRFSPCVLCHAETFDLRKGSFRDGWNIFLRVMREKKITRLTKCAACQLNALCGMCPANAYLENQAPEMPIEFLCQVAYLRAHVLNISLRPHGGCEYC